MKKWTSQINRTFPELKEYKGNGSDLDLDFYIVDDLAKENTIHLAAKNAVCFSWFENNSDYMLAVVKTDKCSQNDIQDKLEEVFDKLLDNSESDLYAARSVLINELHGLEVLGGDIDSKTGNPGDIFYGLYLSDDKEGYVILGFSNDEPENVFAILTGTARMFYRLPNSISVDKSVSVDPNVVAVKNISKQLIPTKYSSWNILNLTFNIIDGKVSLENPEIISISKEGINTPSFNEVFGSRPEKLNDAISELMTTVSPYDLSGFTITVFNDSSYGITYYSIDEDDCHDDDCHDDSCGHDHHHHHHHHDHHHEHGHSCSCNHEDSHECSCNHDDNHECSCNHDESHQCSCGHNHDEEDNMEDNNSTLHKYHHHHGPDYEHSHYHDSEHIHEQGEACNCHNHESYIEKNEVIHDDYMYSEIIKKIKEVYSNIENWNKGLVITNVNDFSKIKGYYNEVGSNYKPIDDKYLPELNKIIRENYSEIMTDEYAEGEQIQYYTFSNDKELDNFERQEKFLFDEFYYPSKENKNETDLRLENIANVFRHNFDDSVAVDYVYFLVRYENDNIIPVELSNSVIGNQILPSTTYDKYYYKIKKDLKELFVENNCDNIFVVIFPGNQVGVIYEFNDFAISSKEILEKVVSEVNLNEYKSQIIDLAKPQILVRNYQIVNEYSLKPGKSKIGGTPDVTTTSKSFEWPKTKDGRSMSFVCQINLLETKSVIQDVLPDKGMLYFFYDINSGENAVIYCEKTSSLNKVYSEDQEDEVFGLGSLFFEKHFSLPDWDPEGVFKDFSSEDIDNYMAISTSIDQIKMLGYPDESISHEEENKDMVLLLQIPSLHNYGMIWGDYTYLYFWIDKEDLEKKDFSKVVCVSSNTSF